MTLLEHLENHLGEINQGWSDKIEGTSETIKVVSFVNEPDDGVTTYSTLGLSEHVLSLSGKKSVCQELIFICDNEFKGSDVASFLISFSEYILGRHKAILRGDVIGPSAPVIDGVKLNSIYATMPVVYDDEFMTFSEGLNPTVFVWLIPIHEKEQEYIRAKGWNSFEDKLESDSPDLFDLDRSSIV